ncbi:MAG TPA: DUF2807 domain-containing protein, partial [Minicystis sp.]|nr:DUF2807 domain-containing protein [Minicystis sp.]
MSNVTRFALGLAALVSSGACVNVGGTVGSGHAKTETRSVAAFHAVDLSGSLEAEVKVGAPQKVEITGDDNLVPLVTTSVEGGKLSVQTKGSF